MEPICPNRFYSSKVQKRSPSKSKRVKQHQVMPSRILSPTQYWKKFNKQADALATAIERSTKTDPLCTFVYEEPSNGRRRFVVAHPEFYWWRYKNIPPEEKCSYEIIPKNSPCWLYLDLEYPLDLNPLCNGSRMTMTLINIIRAYLLNHYHLLCDRSNFLILDSTSTKKFSRHVILTLKDMAFKDNSHVGRFIKTICNDILFYLKSNMPTHGILNHFNMADIQEMLVMTQHGEKLFVDTGVYTKNRQFRLYLSTKWGKQSHLTVSKDCVHNTVNKCREKELGVFLDSLISYFPNKQNLIVLEFVNRSNVKAQLYSKTQQQFIREDDNQISPYPEIDRYIRSLVDPGKIRIVRYSDKTKTLKYEIYGNRYCENIGRYHKSNNVYWIVDLNIKRLYQKCHDPDCSDFTSTPKNLPEEILFKLDTDGDTFLACLTIDEDIMEKM